MNVAMIFPHPDSEKGISAYSINLINNIKKQNIDVKSINFMQGNPFSFFFKIFNLLKYDLIHI